MMASEWIVEGIKLVSVAAPVAGAIAWFVARTVTGHTSNKLLQSHKAELDRVLASHKAELDGKADERRLIHKRQELMFEGEIQAARAFFRLYDELYPTGNGPDPDWEYDAVPQLAERYPEIEEKLEEFLREHSICVSDEVTKLLQRAKNEARDGGYLVAEDTEGEPYLPGRLDPSRDVIASVNRYWEAMAEARKLIRANLKAGTL